METDKKSKPKLDRTGERFGMLLLEEHVGGQFYKCKCDCGNIKKLEYFTLSSGRQVSCGCKRSAKRADLPAKNEKNKGLKVARLSFIEFIDAKTASWRCDCGNIKNIKYTNVVSKHLSKSVKSCGCFASEVRHATLPPASITNHEKAQKEIQTMIGKTYGYLEVIGPGSNGKVSCFCKACGNIRDYKKHNISSGKAKSCGCMTEELRAETLFKTYGEFMKESRGQKFIRELLESWGFNVTSKRVSIIKKEKQKNDLGETTIVDAKYTYTIDIFVESLGLLIEYNGELMHSDRVGRDYKHQYRRTEAANYNNYRMIHIFESDLLSKRNAVISYLRAATGKNSRSYYTRECDFKVIDINIGRDFMDSYHLQGAENRSSLYIGAFVKEELVAVAAFGHPARSNVEVHMNRFCGKMDVSAKGALSYMAKMSLGILKLEKIYSVINLMWSDGSGYLASGWKIERRGSPEHFYYDPKKKKVISKQSRKKSSCPPPPGMNEIQFAIHEGLYVLGDCGKNKVSFSV